MKKNHLKNNRSNIAINKIDEYFLTKLHKIFKFANRSNMQTDLKNDILKMFIYLAQCDMVELRVMEKGLCNVYEAFSAPQPLFQIRKMPYLYDLQVDAEDSSGYNNVDIEMPYVLTY